MSARRGVLVAPFIALAGRRDTMRVLDLRARGDWTQQRMAELMGVARRTVGQWEDGVNKVPAWAADRMQWLDTALQVDQRRATLAAKPCPYLSSLDSLKHSTVLVLEHMRDCPWCLARAVEAVTHNNPGRGE